VNAAYIVYRLLDADWTPPGYRAVDTARAGEYELKLWAGSKHVRGEPVKFNEVSLNRSGLSFEPSQQKEKFPGSIYALGQRQSLFTIVSAWLAQHGTLFVGSHNPAKLSLYYRLFRHYLPQLSITEPYAAFDESEGEADYFRVDKGGISARNRSS
jgi:hypothetical protein